MKAPVLNALIELVEASLVFAVEGSSQRVEQSPAWLEKATDLQEESDGSEHLALTAPMLRDAMGKAWSAYEGWPHAPDGDDTALSLVSRCIHSVWDEEKRIPYFDAGVLDRLQSLCDALPEDAPKTNRLLHPSPDPSATTTDEPDSPYEVDAERDLAMRAHSLSQSIPPSQKFNLRCTIKETAWTRFFWCQLDDIPVRGHARTKGVFGDSIKEWRGKDTFLTGVCSFSPDGTPLYVDVDHAEPYDAKDHAHLAPPLDEIRERAISMRPLQGDTASLSAESVRDDSMEASKWPPEYLKGLVGVLENESTDELLDALGD